MPTVLVFGASGAIGRFVLPLLTPPHHVIPVSRSPRPGWVRADLDDPSFAWPDANTVLSLGPLDAFANWLERVPSLGLRRVVATSSMSVQTKQDSPDPAERLLAQRLLDAETRVRTLAAERGIAWTILRPTLIYGAGVDKTLAPLARFARRWRVLPYPLGASGLRQPVHAADLAAACAAVIAKPATFGRIYELGGGERLRFDAMIRRLRLSARGLVLPLPVPLILMHMLARRALVTPGALARMRMDLVADHAAATRDFHYAARPFRADEVLPGQA